MPEIKKNVAYETDPLMEMEIGRDGLSRTDSLNSAASGKLRSRLGSSLDHPGGYMNTFVPFKKFKACSLIPDCLQEYRGLSDGAIRLWSKLSQMAGAKGFCYPSQEFLASKIGKGIRQTKRLIAELEDEGFILIQHPIKKGQNNTYYFIEHAIFLSALSDINDNQVTQMTLSEGDVNDTQSPEPSDVNDTQKMSDMSLGGDERVSDTTLLYNVVKGSCIVKGSSINGSLDLKGSKTEELKPNGADAPASRKKGVKRIKPSADDMAGEIEKLKQNYPLRYRDLIEKAIGQIALTRKDHSISEGIVEEFLSNLEKYQLWQIGQGIRKYIRGGYAQKGKNEKYLMGIIRGQDKNEGEFAYTDMRLDVGTAPPSVSQTQSSPAAPPVEKKREEYIDFRGNSLGMKAFRVCSQTGHHVDFDEWNDFLTLREKGLIIKGEFYHG